MATRKIHFYAYDDIELKADINRWLEYNSLYELINIESDSTNQTFIHLFCITATFRWTGS